MKILSETVYKRLTTFNTINIERNENSMLNDKKRERNVNHQNPI